MLYYYYLDSYVYAHPRTAGCVVLPASNDVRYQERRQTTLFSQLGAQVLSKVSKTNEFFIFSRVFLRKLFF